MIRSAAPALALGLSLSLPAGGEDDPSSEPGRQAYQYCVACHGPDGKGVRADGLLMAPSLHDSLLLKGNFPELVTAVILKGIVKEDAKFVQAMPPHEEMLKDDQIAALIGHLTREFGGKQVSATAGDVRKWRVENSSRTSPWKRGDVESMYLEASSPKYLSDVRYAIYEGSWTSLPDFSILEPAGSGRLDHGLISLDPAGKLDRGFGMAFDADLTVQQEGNYQFTLTSDDGAALVIDGETIVASHGAGARKTESRGERLDAGHHTLRVLYFNAAGKSALTLSVKGPGKLGTRWLTTEKGEGNRGQSNHAIRLTPRNPGEAVVHRSFVPDAKPRAIGVGYPGAVNLVWDADVLNLAYVYRGEFMDVAPLWNGRGSSSKPLGRDREIISPGLPFQVLRNLTEAWVPFSEAKVKYKRDTARTDDEITINVRHPDYQFRGYRLDDKRFPTFNYDYRKLAVTDRFEPVEIEGVTALVRTLKIEGVADPNTYLRVAESASEPGDDGWIGVSDHLKLRISGAEAVTRDSGGRSETLVPVTGDQTLTIAYRWNTSLQP
jgi:mono/diheme cytochrome c family protein